MKELIKVFNGAELNIEMINETEFMIDVSGIMTKNNKRFSRWEEVNLNYIKLVQKRTNLNKTDLIRVVGHTTKIHNKLLVNFARYISDDFAVWCDDFIYKYLTEEKTKYISKLEEQCNINQNKVEQLKVQLSESGRVIKRFSERAYAKRRDGNLQTVTRIIRDYELDVTPNKLNELLVKNNLLDFEVIEIFQFKGDVMNGNTPLVHVDSVLEIADDEGIKRGVEDAQQAFEF